MNNQAKLLAVLKSSGPLCDDCLSSTAAVKPRQQVNRKIRELVGANRVHRLTRQCPGCKSNKLVNELLNTNSIPTVPRGENKVVSKDRPWYWEGNVQAALIKHLENEGWTLIRSADTAARSAGKDIVVRRRNEELWVSVKGWPQKSVNVQARHWFSHALFDLVMYRTENPDVRLAIGLPGGFITYQNLIPRVSWLRTKLPCEIFLVMESGTVMTVAASDG